MARLLQNVEKNIGSYEIRIGFLWIFAKCNYKY